MLPIHMPNGLFIENRATSSVLAAEHSAAFLAWKDVKSINPLLKWLVKVTAYREMTAPRNRGERRHGRET